MSNNPWGDAHSQGKPYTSPTQENSNPWGQQQQPGQQQGQQHPQHQQSGNQQYGAYQPPGGPPPSHQQQYQQQQYPQHQQHNTPQPGISRTDTGSLLASQPDAASQVEHMQQYESHAPQSQEDKDQAQLQKEYPSIDSTLIAALYNERKPNVDLAEVRELLQELGGAS